jgi:hypothetical protein
MSLGMLFALRQIADELSELTTVGESAASRPHRLKGTSAGHGVTKFHQNCHHVKWRPARIAIIFLGSDVVTPEEIRALNLRFRNPCRGILSVNDGNRHIASAHLGGL